MFLTRKALKKIRLLTGAYLVLAAVCLIASCVFALLLAEGKLLVILSIVCLGFGGLFHVCARFTEGKGNLINSGNRLVFQELRPAAFIRLYEEKRDHPDNVISQPDFDVLLLLATAYDALGDPASGLETLDQVISVAPEKKMPIAKLMKASMLFSIGRTQEAELLYTAVQNGKMDLMTKATLDVVTKSDRATALGDYATAMAYYNQKLAQTFPKNTPLAVLYAHFALGKIYHKTQRLDEAKVHLNYCIENAGETGIKSEAANMLKNI